MSEIFSVLKIGFPPSLDLRVASPLQEHRGRNACLLRVRRCVYWPEPCPKPVMESPLFFGLLICRMGAGGGFSHLISSSDEMGWGRGGCVSTSHELGLSPKEWDRVTGPSWEGAVPSNVGRGNVGPPGFPPQV